MLKAVRNPKGQLIPFAYDALRRTAKLLIQKFIPFLRA